MKLVIQFIKKETVLCIAALLALVSAFFVPPDAEYIGYINFRVLGLLFALMIVVAGFRKLYIFDRIAVKLTIKCSNMRLLVLVLTSLCFFSSMLITNDVALLTFVPLAINVLIIANAEKYIIYTVILQTIAANMGSMLTPMGNPQNLYLSDFYGMDMAGFFSATMPICLVSGIIILLMHIPIRAENVNASVGTEYGIIDKKLLCMYIFLGIFAFAAVFNFITDKLYIALTAAALLLTLIFDRSVIKKVDWFLLLTFVMFFIFVGNAARIAPVREFAGTLTQGREIISGAISSQFISNVPAAVMLSSFTDNGKALMIGVDIGGLGTPIASLASLIGYRLYAAYENSDKNKYMLVFLFINFVMLAALLVISHILYPDIV